MMIVGCMVIVWVAGMLIGGVMAYDKGFKAGKSWGFELGVASYEGAEVEARIRSLM